MTKAEKEVLKKNFGKFVKNIRESKDLSLQEVASRCSLDDSNISKIEHGKRDSSLTTIAELAEGLGVTLAEIFKGKF
ncbi:MAG TPA: helix-turn-helix transcriptional regulator [Puia sp.]|nr:helix-turn-helix transcriptional regulator [Puia sp.]